jgi:hypothetical protein
MVGNIEIVTILTILFFGISLLISIFRTDVMKRISLARITRTINHAFVIQVIIGLTFLISMLFLESKYYLNEQENDLRDIFVGTGYTYLMIGLFFYFPGLLLLNIINLIFKRKFSSNE